MSLTAHPYVVLAEQQWKQESFGGANRAPRRPRHDRGQGPVLRALRSVAAAVQPRRNERHHSGRHTARPV